MRRRRQSGAGLPARDETGAVAVEFALLFPLLFVLLFGTLVVGWRVWEHQAAQAAAGDATRLATLGIDDLDGYRHDVICLGERDGLQPGSLTEVTVTFLGPTMTSSGPASSSGGFVRTTLTYRSALGALPWLPFGGAPSDGGTFMASAIGPVEQVGDIDDDQALATSGERCG